MSLQRTPPKTTTISLGHTQSETDLNTLQLSDVSFVNMSRNKRQRTNLDTEDEKTEGNGLKEEVMSLLADWKKELDAKLNDMCDKQNSLVTKLSLDIAELKQQTANIKKSNDEIIHSMSFINKQYDEIKATLDNMQKERLEQRRSIEGIERKLHDLQLKSRSSCIEIRNVPQSDKETTGFLTDAVRKIGETTGMALSSSDLRDVYRVPGKSGTTRPIVAEFQTVQMKINTLAAVRNYNNKKAIVEEKLNSQDISIPGKRQPIYVTDHLPASSKKLFHLAREFAKQNSFKFCWYTNGNIFIRKAQGDKQILISSEQTLIELRKNM